MAANFTTSSRATVTDATGAELYAKAQVTVRAGQASVHPPGQGRITKAGVVTAERTAARQWTVTFEDGTVWSITEARGCGCGK